MIKKGLLLIIILLSFSTKVFGSFDETDKNGPKLYFFQNYVLKEHRSGVNIFLFSNATLEARGQDDIFLFFSNIEIGSEIRGNVYSFFSNIILNSDGKVNSISSLSSTITYLKDSPEFQIKPVVKVMDFLININEQNGYVIYKDKIPSFILILLMIFVKTFVCMIFFALRKGFFLQGSMTVIHDKSYIFKNGILSYIIFIAMIIVFLLSVLGVPISLMVFAVFYICIICGQVSFSLFIGNEVLSNTNKRFTINTKLILGVILLETLSFFPFIYYFIKFFVYPILFTGIFMTSVINVYIKKIFYNIPYVSENAIKHFDSNKIKEIIMKEIDKV